MRCLRRWVGPGLVEDGTGHGLAEVACEDVLGKAAGANEGLNGSLAGDGDFGGDEEVVNYLERDEVTFVLQGTFGPVWVGFEGGGVPS